MRRYSRTPVLRSYRQAASASGGWLQRAPWALLRSLISGLPIDEGKAGTADPTETGRPEESRLSAHHDSRMTGLKNSTPVRLRLVKICVWLNFFERDNRVRFESDDPPINTMKLRDCPMKKLASQEHRRCAKSGYSLGATKKS